MVLGCVWPVCAVGDKVSVLNANPLYVEAECVEGDRKGVTGKFMPKCVNFDNTFVGASAAAQSAERGRRELCRAVWCVVGCVR